MLSRHLATTIVTLAAVLSQASGTVISNSTALLIAGGGLTGLVVANKLSAKGYSVLVIEAGRDEKNNSGVYNAALEKTLVSPDLCNFKYTGSAENGTDLSILIDSGNCLGGSSSINGMVWFRPAAAELDALETLGNPGWNSATLFPYTTAVERNIAPTAAQRAQGANVVPAVHGHYGQVIVSFATPMRIPVAQQLYKAAIKLVLGLDQSPDLSSRAGAVSSSTSWTIWYDAVAGINRRSSAAWAFLYPASQSRSTLTVLTSHIVGSVIFQGTTATGLQFGASAGGPLYKVYARREVLLAAGSLASSAILERSGVGAKAVLDQFGITQVVELPGVGMNLQDQPGTGLAALFNTANDSNTLLIDDVNIFAPVIALPSLTQLFDNATASTLAADLQSNIQSRAEAVVAAGGAVNVAGATKLYQVMADLITKDAMPIAELVGETYPSVATSIFWPTTPLSRGHIHINSSSPYAHPRITPRFLTDTFDLATAVATAKAARAMFESAPFSGVVSYAVIDAVADNATDAEWAAWYQGSAYGASHWLGSTAMRPLAHGGVVSPTLNVYGTTSLRVVDVGVLPFSFTCHTMPVAYALAQRAADLILGS